jgi:hypothetical protein
VISYRVEKIIALILLFLGFAIRIHDLSVIPSGFSEEEIQSLRVIQTIRNGNIAVFHQVGVWGIGDLFHLLQVAVTQFVGDGLLGYRMLPLWSGVLSLALIYALARRLFGGIIALIAMMSMCFGILPVLTSRTATEVSLMTTLVLGTLLIIARTYYLWGHIRPFRPHTTPYSLVAIAVAIAAYEHYTGILVGIGLLIFIFYLRYTRQPVHRNTWWNSIYCVTFAIILGLPYLLSILRDPPSSNLYILWANRPPDTAAFFESTFKTFLAFWIRRGDTNPAHNIPGLPLTSLVEPVLLTVGIAVSLRRWRLPNYGLILIFFILGLLPDIWLNGGPDYTALTFVSPIIYILIGIGLVESYRFLRTNQEIPERLAWIRDTRWLGQWPQPLMRLFIGLILLTAAIDILRLRQNVFMDWTARSDTQQAYQSNLGDIAIYLDRHPDDNPVLICTTQFRPTEVDDFQTPLADQQLLELMLHHEDINFRVANCRNDLIFINGGEPMRVLFADPSDAGRLPTELQAWFNLSQPISNDAIPEGIAFQLDVEQALANNLGQLQLTSTVYYPPVPETIDEIAPYPVRFGGNMTFVGYLPHARPTGSSLNPGDVLTVVSYWRIDGDVLPNTGIFVRLHDTPQSSPYTEINEFGVDATRLQTRDVIVQVGYLTLPTLRDQEYRLTIGVYDNTPVNQLPVYKDISEIRGSHLLLGLPFMVVSP